MPRIFWNGTFFRVNTQCAVTRRSYHKYQLALHRHGMMAFSRFWKMIEYQMEMVKACTVKDIAGNNLIFI